jgi:hypothetical protein
MRRLRRRILVAAATVFALGASLAAQPTAYFSESANAAMSRAHWVPGSIRPMSAYEESVGFVPTPH